VDQLTPIKSSWVNVDPVAAYKRTLRVARDLREDALSLIVEKLDTAKASYAQTPPSDVVAYLGETLGVPQLVIARALNVTPTAVRKWRRGESARPERRGALAAFAAMCNLLIELGLHDPAGWLDIPISSKSTLSPLDLFVAGRADLVVLLGARLADPHEALDTFDGEWRDRYAVDPDYDIVMLRDGSRSAVPRRKDRS